MLDGRPQAVVRLKPEPEASTLSLPPLREPLRFDDFYRAEFRAVAGLALALTGSHTAAEELAQEAFVATYRRWDKVQAYDDPGAWVRRVLVNRCRSWGRRQAAEVRAMTRLRHRREPLPALEPADDEFWAAVRALPARQAQVIALHYLDDMPVAQISRVLGVSSGAIKTHLHRGRQALVQTLELDGPT